MTKNAFIRPTAAGDNLGGVARNSKDALLLCESAGFDVIFVETVGVGQSETMVHDMVDYFLLLMLAGAGDELQGMKRGIMELADTLLITKADSGNEKKSDQARREYANAVHLFPPKPSQWITNVLTTSSVTVAMVLAAIVADLCCIPHTSTSCAVSTSLLVLLLPALLPLPWKADSSKRFVAGPSGASTRW